MAKEKNKIKIIFFVVITAIAVGGVIYIWQNSQTSKPKQDLHQNIIKSDITSTSTSESVVKNEFFSYSLKGIPATVTKEEMPFNFIASELELNAEGCGSKHTVGYFDKLIAKFKGVNKIVYNFKYQGESQTDLVFKITILPNKAGYTSIDQFKKDFDQCFIAGDAYPWSLNKDWLLFVNACGSGIDDESGRPDGCGKVNAVVESNLKLNY